MQGDACLHVPRAGPLLFAAAGLVVLAVSLMCNWSLLDLLNASVAAQTDFKVFHAGGCARVAPCDMYPELEILERNFQALRREVCAVLPLVERVPTMQSTYNEMFLGIADPDKGGRGWARRGARMLWRLLYGKHLDIFNDIQSRGWRTLNLVVYNRVVWDNARLCPLLVDHLLRLPSVQTALLSFMMPGATVPPHSDPATGVLRYHLAFVVPRDRESCYMRVDGQKYAWREGEGVVFDTVFEHSVANLTEECRVVLFLDLHRPLAPPARWLQGLADSINSVAPGTRAVVERSGLLTIPVRGSAFPGRPATDSSPPESSSPVPLCRWG